MRRQWNRNCEKKKIIREGRKFVIGSFLHHRLGQQQQHHRSEVMDALQSHTNNPNLNLNSNPLASSVPLWPTIDGPLGLSEEESVKYARRFYKFGFALLPLLWAVNCFYFWPVIRHSRSFPTIRPCLYLSFHFSFLFELTLSATFFSFIQMLTCFILFANSTFLLPYYALFASTDYA